jgi:hypothetical protein
MPHDVGASPLAQTNSPGGLRTPGSGGSTPQHVAPPVPSMLASSPSSGATPLANHLSNQTITSLVRAIRAEVYRSRLELHENETSVGSGTVSSLRRIKARKVATLAKEYDAYGQNLDESVIQAIQAATTEKAAAAWSNDDRVIFDQMQDEMKSLRAEVESLKKDRENTLSRRDDSNTLISLRQDVNKISEQLKPLDDAPASFSEPQSTMKLNELMRWKENHPKPCSIEQVTDLVEAHTNSALKYIKANIALPKGADTQNRASDVASLIEFQRRIEKDDWPNQIKTLKERIETIVDREAETRDLVEAKEKHLKHTINKEVDLVARRIVKERDLLERSIDDKASELQKGVIADCQSELKKLQQELTGCQGKLGNVSQVITFQSKLDRIEIDLKAKLLTATSKQDRLESDLKKTTDTTTELTTTLNKLESDLENTMGAATNVTDQLDSLEKDFAKHKADIGTEMANGLSKMETELDSKLTTHVTEVLNVRLNTANIRLNTLNDSMKNLEQSAVDRNQERIAETSQLGSRIGVVERSVSRVKEAKANSAPADASTAERSASSAELVSAPMIGFEERVSKLESAAVDTVALDDRVKKLETEVVQTAALNDKVTHLETEVGTVRNSAKAVPNQWQSFANVTIVYR